MRPTGSLHAQAAEVDNLQPAAQFLRTHPGGLDKRLRYCWPDTEAAQRSDPMNLIQFTLA